MLPIYICDDEKFWLELITKSITEYQIKSDWELELKCTSTSPQEIIQRLSSDKPQSGIYFLDIDLKNSINGMELAKTIRQFDSQASIVFVTTHDEMVMETFRLKLEALDYIIKDSFEIATQIHRCLEHLENKYTSSTNSSSATITIRAEGSYKSIPLHNIYFIESLKNAHKVQLHTENAVYYINDTITSLKEVLGSDFIQSHKAYLVNIKHIKELDIKNHRILLDNGACCLCSVREWSRLVKLFK